MKNNQYIFLHLNLIPGIGPAVVQALIEHKPISMLWEDLYQLLPSDFQHMFGLSPSVATSVVHGLRNRDLLEKEKKLLNEHHVSWVSILNDSYPQALKQIAQPPIGLYVQGKPLPDYAYALAVVGSRKGDRYGQQIIDTFVPILVQNNWSIVSGGALGIDTMAHQAALDAAGHTVVVLGSGLCVAYPLSNKKLFDKILEAGGTLVSSFPMQTQPKTGNFPARNRIIAGLTRGCFVVQAAERSGARITAQYALDQGREVFSVPGAFDHPLSAGCHALIHDGATLITKPEDILAMFGQRIAQPRVVQTVVQKRIHSVPTQIVQKTIDTDMHPIVQACLQPTSINDLLDLTGMSLQEVQQKLFQLQLDGEIKQDFTGLWSRV